MCVFRSRSFDENIFTDIWMKFKSRAYTLTNSWQAELCTEWPVEWDKQRHRCKYSCAMVGMTPMISFMIVQWTGFDLSVGSQLSMTSILTWLPRASISRWVLSSSYPFERPEHSRTCGESFGYPAAQKIFEEDVFVGMNMPMKWAQTNARFYSLHRKQHLWKLLPSHCTSSAWYTVPWQAPHLFPPPQLGIVVVVLQKKHI